MFFTLKIIFFFSLFMIFYVYLGYPILVFIFGLFKNKKVLKGSYEPYVTILIAAYNEEDNIEATLKNKLALDYPKDKFDIIVISDESTDRTDEIVRQYSSQNVKLLRQEPRAGKTSALNMTVPEAKGDILVFSDANSIYAPDALKKLLRNFKDPSVGYVTGKMIYTNPDGSTIGDGCTTYMKYENFLRQFETRIGSVVGVDGGIDAIRKSLYISMNPDQLPDFVLPLKVVEQGYRVVYEREAILKEPTLKAPKDEYKMRVRVSLRALWALSDMRHLLTFTRSSSSLSSSSGTPSHLRTFAPSFLYSLQLWSHKVLRYLCFAFLIIAYFTNLLLWPYGTFYKVFFILQNLAYIAAIVSPLLEKKMFLAKLFYLPRYYVLLNLASAHAFIKFVLRQKQVLWAPRKG
jgi:cellulose synthase/poly-beta-1,6-N-acetylglucosamine synthase-like glycosyltransferase